MANATLIRGLDFGDNLTPEVEMELIFGSAKRLLFLGVLAFKPGQAPLALSHGQTLILDDLNLRVLVEQKLSPLALSINVQSLGQEKAQGEMFNWSLRQMLEQSAYSPAEDNAFSVLCIKPIQA